MPERDKPFYIDLMLTKSILTRRTRAEGSSLGNSFEKLQTGDGCMLMTLCVYVLITLVMSNSCDLVDLSPLGSSVHEILSRQEYWNELSMPPPAYVPDPGIEPVSPELVGRFFITSTTWEAREMVGWWKMSKVSISVLPGISIKIIIHKAEHIIKCMPRFFCFSVQVR